MKTRIRKRISRERGFMMMDVMAGIILLTALAGALAVATNLRQRNAQHLIDQRTAMRIAQDALAAGQAPQNSPAKVSIARTGTRVGSREWIEVSVVYNGRHAALAGLAPAEGDSR
jgi:Tfp pilus assembly protein PilX